MFFKVTTALECNKPSYAENAKLHLSEMWIYNKLLLHERVNWFALLGM